MQLTILRRDLVRALCISAICATSAASGLPTITAVEVSPTPTPTQTPVPTCTFDLNPPITFTSFPPTPRVGDVVRVSVTVGSTPPGQCQLLINGPSFDIARLILGGCSGGSGSSLLFEMTAVEPGTTSLVLDGSFQIDALPPCPQPPPTEIMSAPFPMTVLPATCVGDCNGDHTVTVDELLTMVNVALGNDAGRCLSIAAWCADNVADVACILRAVNDALAGCE